MNHISFSQLYHVVLSVKMMTEAKSVGDTENVAVTPVVLHVFFLHNYPPGAGDWEGSQEYLNPIW